MFTSHIIKICKWYLFILYSIAWLKIKIINNTENLTIQINYIILLKKYE